MQMGTAGIWVEELAIGMGTVAIQVGKAPIRMGPLPMAGCDAPIPGCDPPIQMGALPFAIGALPIWIAMTPEEREGTRGPGGGMPDPRARGVLRGGTSAGRKVTAATRDGGARASGALARAGSVSSPLDGRRGRSGEGGKPRPG